MPWLPWAGGWQNLCRKIPAFPFSPERDPVLLNTPWAQRSQVPVLWAASGVQQICSPLQHESLCSLAAAAAAAVPWWKHLQPPWGPAQLLGQSSALGAVEKKPFREPGDVPPGSLGSAPFYPFRGAFTWNLNSQGSALQRAWTRKTDFWDIRSVISGWWQQDVGR